MGQNHRIWAIFETDELGNPKTKLARSGRVSCRLSLERQENSSLADVVASSVKNWDVGAIGPTPFFNSPLQPMVWNWQTSVSLQSKWQFAISKMQRSQLQFSDIKDDTHWDDQMKKNNTLSARGRSHLSDQHLLGGGFNIMKEATVEAGGAVSMHELSDEPSRDANIILPTYRLHVENPESEFFDVGLAAPLILNGSLLEQKHNCLGKDLQTLSFLNLNHEGLSSLGEVILIYWCPSARIFTADMNRLSSVSNAFIGYEETLEQLSLKDNFLCDLSGLEHMHKLQVLHLDGNYILQVTASSFSLPQNNTERIGLTALGHLNYKDKAKIEPRACWPDLKEFGLSCNRISKIERLELLCPKLQVLDLGSNNLSSLGGLEESGLLGLQCLRVLDVGQNRLNGKSLWDSLIHCPLLVSLVASRNLLQELPTHVGSIFLRELWLNGNIIKCFSCIAWMPNLQRLYLQDNEIDTLMPIWGLPSLEVLDLSFNKIANVQQLNQLGCFSKLRSLQLNDNPVAELPDYIEKVLEAVPWLVELDNEPLTDHARSRAVKNIFLNVINSVGLWYVRSTIKKGHMPYTGVSDVSTLNAGRQPSDLMANAHNSSHRIEPILGNKILAGDSDIRVLWAMLLEIWWRMYDTYSPCAIECQWRIQSLQLMCLDHKKRLFNSLRESCSTKQVKDYPLHNLSDFYLGQEGIQSMYDNKQTECDSLVRDGYIADLKDCMLEHLNFSDNHYKEKVHRNESYEAEVRLYLQRIISIQAIIRGFLVRSKCQKHIYNLPASCLQAHQDLHHHAATKVQAYWKGWNLRKSFLSKKLAIVKIQTLWRGFRTRRRFQLARKISIFDDFDEFNYTIVGDSLFLPENFCFEELDLNMHGCGSQEMENQQLHHYLENEAFLQSTSNTNMDAMKLYKGSNDQHLHTSDERKNAVAEIAKDWGFHNEKTALQLMRALENTKRTQAKLSKTSLVQQPDSQTRFKGFVANCEKNCWNKFGITIETPRVSIQANPNNVGLNSSTKYIRKSSPAKTRAVTHEKKYIKASVTTLSFDGKMNHQKEIS